MVGEDRLSRAVRGGAVRLQPPDSGIAASSERELERDLASDSERDSASDPESHSAIDRASDQLSDSATAPRAAW